MTKPMGIAAVALACTSLLAVVGTIRMCASPLGRKSPGKKHDDHEVVYVPLALGEFDGDQDENEPLCGAENSRTAEMCSNAFDNRLTQMSEVGNISCLQHDIETPEAPLLLDHASQEQFCLACDGLGCSLCRSNVDAAT